MPRRSHHAAVEEIGPAGLAGSRPGLRRRYTDEEILEELRACAGRLGRSPTMGEFASDRRTRVHPQTVIGHFGTWNRGKREAGLVARRFATREELLGQLRALGDELGRVPRGKDLVERRATMPSKSLYWHTFGSLRRALREAGFDVPLGEERRGRAAEEGVRLALKLRRLPKFADWVNARRADPAMLTEWQVYRLFGARRGSWSKLQLLIRERLVAAGVEVGADGRIKRRPSAASAPLSRNAR